MLYTVLKSSILQSLMIRAVGLSGRLIVLFVTVRYLTAESLGVFNLAQAGIGIMSLLAGAELVQFLNREIANQPDGTPPKMVAEYFAMTLPLVVIAIAAFGLFTTISLLSGKDFEAPNVLLFLFCSVFVFEHYSNEMQRILIAAKAMIAANIILLIRAGLWPFFALLYVIFAGQLDLVSILTFWGAATSIAVLYGIWCLSRLGAFATYSKPTLTFVKAAVKLSLPLFIGMAFQRAPFFLDKYFLSTSGFALVGNYSVLLSLSLVPRMLFEASILAYFTPRLLRADSVTGPGKSLVSIYGTALIFTGMLGATLFALQVPILSALNKMNLVDYSFAFGALIVAVCLVSISLVSTLVLIARRQQNKLLGCDALYFMVFLALMLVGFGTKIDTLIHAHLISALCLMLSKLFFVVIRSDPVQEHNA